MAALVVALVAASVAASVVASVVDHQFPCHFVVAAAVAVDALPDPVLLALVDAVAVAESVNVLVLCDAQSLLVIALGDGCRIIDILVLCIWNNTSSYLFPCFRLKKHFLKSSHVEIVLIYYVRFIS